MFVFAFFPILRIEHLKIDFAFKREYVLVTDFLLCSSGRDKGADSTNFYHLATDCALVFSRLITAISEKGGKHYYDSMIVWAEPVSLETRELLTAYLLYSIGDQMS